MRSLTGGLAAFGIGLVLAGATAYGVVEAQQGRDAAPVSVENVTYGSND